MDGRNTAMGIRSAVVENGGRRLFFEGGQVARHPSNCPL